MATLFTHAFTAYSFNKLAPDFNGQRRCLWYSMLFSALPDADVLGFAFGIAYGDLLGHRGLTHSLLFALVFAALMVLVLFYGKRYRMRDRLIAFMLLFFSIASHGALDAMTNGGLGIAFFSPFDETRYFFDFRPLEVSPIGIRRFLSARGASIMLNEMFYVWLPLLMLLGVKFLLDFAKARVNGSS